MPAFYLPYNPIFNSNGLPIPEAQVFFYAPGTDTKLPVYNDEELTIPLPNPVSADAAARLPAIYFPADQDYRVVIRKPPLSTGGVGAIVEEIDPFVPGTYPQGPVGPPGGNVMALGTITEAELMEVPEGTDLVSVTGDTTSGDEAAGLRLAYDATVDAAYIAQHPRRSFIDDAGRGFRGVPDPYIPPIIVEARGSGLDDSANLQDAVDLMIAEKRDLVLKPGLDFIVNETVVFNFAAFGDNSMRKLKISAYGTRITGTAETFLQVTEGFAPYGLILEGFAFDVNDNAVTLRGIEIVGADCVTVRDTMFRVGDTHADFDGVLVRAIDPTNNDTNSFWCKFEGITMNVDNGAQSRPRSAIHLLGNANATVIRDCELSYAENAIWLDVDPDDPTDTLANGVLIDGNAIEGNLVGIRVTPGAATYAAGLRITNNRGENNDTAFLSIDGGIQPENNMGIYLSGNHLLQDDIYVVNPDSILYTSYDAMFNPAVSPTLFSRDGMTSRPSISYAFKSYPYNGTGGYNLRTAFNVDLGTWAARAAGGSLIGGATDLVPMHTKNTFLSTKDTECRNGTGVTVFAGEASKVITVPVEEANTSYCLMLSVRDNVPGVLHWEATSTTTATIYAKKPDGTAFSGVVFWFMLR